MLESTRTAPGAAFVPLLLALSLAAQAPAPTSVTLAYKSLPKWSLVLPKETWTPIGANIPIPHAGDAKGFSASLERMTLSIDTDGDGKTDTDVKGTSGFAELRGKTAAGKAFTYAIRVTNDGTACKFAVSGAMTGSLNGTAISLVDANNNGVYDEVGRDAIVVGDGRAASWLSKVVNVKGELFTIVVAADGQTLTATPFTGETGTLELRSGFKSTGELASVVVSDDAIGCSFNLAQVKSLVVPAGKYLISGGLAQKGSETVHIGPGKMRALSVEAKKTTTLTWGSTVSAEFDFARAGEQVTVQPNVKYFGSAGEEYYDFLPEAKSPKFFVYDSASKKLLATGRFGGC